mmetsp:Transcript_5350/g.17779  ORF Transcript_5350/g.17779 Transcript_5350/m.17779 type:complete len:294 (-) Transcript_5350:1108-1989(-)
MIWTLKNSPSAPPHPHSCATLPSIFATNTTVDSRARKRPCSSTPTAFVSCSAAAAGSASGALRSMSTIRLPLSVVKGIRLSLAPGSPAGALPFRIRALQPASGGSAAIRRTVRCAKVGVISTGIGYEVPTLSQSLDSSTHTTIFFAASCTSFSRRSAPLPPLTTLRSRSTASADPIARSIEAVLSALRQGMPSRCSSASVLSEVGTALMPDSSPLLIRSASRSSTKPTVEPASRGWPVLGRAGLAPPALRTNNVERVWGRAAGRSRTPRGGAEDRRLSSRPRHPCPPRAPCQT